MSQPLLVIIGPTAVGKTEIAVDVALEVGGEILSADSMQVYQGMNIGTAKPTPAERKGVPHHLIDIVPPDVKFSVAEYQRLAWDTIRDVAGRGHLPILSGGTGLYVDSVIRGYTFVDLETDWELRRALLRQIESEGSQAMHRRLAEVDPVTAQRVHPNDARRIVRALEVYMSTGKPLSELSGRGSGPVLDCLVLGLTRPRDALYKRIEERVDRMLTTGLIEETMGLLRSGYSPDLFSMNSLGYRESVMYLRGLATLSETRRILARNTRHYARRQYTWFRKNKGIIWINLGHATSTQEVVEDIVRRVEGKWPRV